MPAPDLARTAPLVARLACAVFFGAALYINLVQHPAALETGTEFALRFFGPMYERAARMQASAAIVGAAAGALVWWRGESARWLLGAMLLFAVVPVTLAAIMPVNAQLLATPGPAPAEADLLLRRWGWLHGIRTALSGAALVLFLLAPRRP